MFYVVCKWGACPPPPVLRSSMLTVKKECHHNVGSKGRLGRTGCLQMGGGCPATQPPACFKPSILAVENHVITINAAGEGCADHFANAGTTAVPNPNLPFFRTHPCPRFKNHIEDYTMKTIILGLWLSVMIIIIVSNASSHFITTVMLTLISIMTSVIHSHLCSGYHYSVDLSQEHHNRKDYPRGVFSYFNIKLSST